MILDADGVERDWIAGYQPPAETFMKRLGDAVEGRNTVRDLRRRLQAEPKNPEIRILLGRKYQERYDRARALPLFQEAAKLDPESKIMTRSDDGVLVSCRDMAEFQEARTYVVTWGTIEPRRLTAFNKSHSTSPLLREAYIEASRFMDANDLEDQGFYREMFDRFPYEAAALADLGDDLARQEARQTPKPLWEGASEYAEKTKTRLEKYSVSDAAKILADLRALKGDWNGAEAAYGPDFLSGQTKAWARSLLEYADYWMLRKRNEADALEAARLALKLRPDDAGIRQSAARVFLSNPPHMDEALAAYGPAWLQSGDHTPPEIYDYFSFWLTRKVNLESAFAALDSLWIREPDSLHFRVSAATALWKSGEKDRAQAVFGPAYAAAHADRLAHLYRYGIFWAARGSNLETAVPALIKAAPEGNSWSDILQAAEMLNRIGRGAEAEKFFGPSYLETIADNSPALGSYVRFWGQLGTRPQTVLRALELIEKMPGLDFFERQQAASNYLKLGRSDKAEAIYGPSYLSTITRDAVQLAWYAQFWQYRHKNLKSAMEAARAAVTVDPSLADGWGALAELLLIDGKAEEGRQAIEKALGLAKGDRAREQYRQRLNEISAAGSEKKKDS